MQPDILKELGLAPRWIRKELHAAACATAAAAPQPVAVPSAPPASAAAPPLPVAVPTAASAPIPAPAAVPAFPIHKMDWTKLHESVQTCTQCPLHHGRLRPAFGVGDKQAAVMFVGEGPGEEEDKRGEPFVGRAGRLLDHMLHIIGLSRRRNVYIANVVKCRPPANRNPDPAEARQCMPYLQRQIALIQPTLLVALGRVAASHLLNTDASIVRLRGHIHDCNGIPLIVTYHPAYLLRQPQEKQKSWQDLKTIRQILADQ